DRREGMAKLSGQVEALRSKTGATAEEIERLDTGIEEAKARAETAAEELEQVKAEDGSGEADDADLQQRYEQAVAANDAADARVNELVDGERGAERDIASEQARLDALYMGLSRKDGAGALLEASEEVPGVLGSVSAL